MKSFFFVLLFPVLSACAQVKANQKDYSIRPGEVRWIKFEVPNGQVELYCRDEKVKIQRKGKEAEAVIIESYFSDLSPFSCAVKENGRVVHELRFKVEEREYKAEQLKVDVKKIKLSPKDQKRADAEQLVLNKIYGHSSPEFLFSKAFVQPMNNFVTSVYGTRRVYNKQKKGQHLGIDYRAAIGDKVPTANSGRVVFAGDLFYTGWTVIVDHGLDIFTVYGHLSKPLVEAGQMVERGQVIALSGNTGRTSGPHLHWGVKVQGQYVDGFVLIDETKKVFKD